MASQVFPPLWKSTFGGASPKQKTFHKSIWIFFCCRPIEVSNKSELSLITVCVTQVKVILTQSMSIVSSGHSIKPRRKLSPKRRVINKEASYGRMLIKRKQDQLLTEDGYKSGNLRGDQSTLPIIHPSIHFLLCLLLLRGPGFQGSTWGLSSEGSIASKRRDEWQKASDRWELPINLTGIALDNGRK